MVNLSKYNKVGILGGTFNPIHIGHLIVAQEVLENCNLEHILFIPLNIPPHKKVPAISPLIRYKMVQLAIEDNPLFSVSDIEIKRGGVSYTIDTLSSLKEKFGSVQFYLIMGLDTFLLIHTWKNYQKLLTSIPIIITTRPGHSWQDLLKLHPSVKSLLNLKKFSFNKKEEIIIKINQDFINLIFLPITGIDISSSMIRWKIANNKLFKYYIPDKVYNYIVTNKIYKKEVVD